MKKFLAMLIVVSLVIASLAIIPVAGEPNLNVFNGNYSVKVTVSSNYKYYGNCSLVLEANTDYIISCWAKGSGSSSIRFLPTGSQGWKDSENIMTFSSSTITEKSGAWSHYSKTFNSGACTSKGKLYFFTNSYGSKNTRYVDDIVVAKADAPDVNLLVNGDFEENTGWTYSTGNLEREYSDTVMKNGDIDYDAIAAEEVSNEHVYDGHYAIKIENNTEDSFTYFVGETVALEADTDYILSAWTKGDGNPNLRLLKSDHTGSIKEISLGGSDWSMVSGTFNSGSNTAGSIAFANNPWGYSGEMYVDNIVLARADAPDVNLLRYGDFEAAGYWSFGETIFFKERSGIRMIEGEPASFKFADSLGYESSVILADGMKVKPYSSTGVSLIALYNADGFLIKAMTITEETALTKSDLADVALIKGFVVDSIYTLKPLAKANEVSR